MFTQPDIAYLLQWLGCARKNGLTISYLGGWNESDNGSHAGWYGKLRTALNEAGYRGVQIVAADTFAPRSRNPWPYPSVGAVSILGNHDVCGYPTGSLGPRTACALTRAARRSGKRLWASELGAMDAGAQAGCKVPCAPAMDRATVRGYIDVRLTGYLEWPVLDAMPSSGLPFENRGLVTADQPWSGHYSVNAMTWAIAQFTQFVSPPLGSRDLWRYVDTASGFPQGNRKNGSYVTLVHSGGTAWSSIIETTSASKAQQADFTISGGASGLAGEPVHVRASNFNFNFGAGPSHWFMPLATITPVHRKFTIKLKPVAARARRDRGRRVHRYLAAGPVPGPVHHAVAAGRTRSADVVRYVVGRIIWPGQLRPHAAGHRKAAASGLRGALLPLPAFRAPAGAPDGYQASSEGATCRSRPQ